MENELKTYGDLKKAIKTISTGQRKEKVGGVGIDAIIGQIPIIGNIKTGVDLVRAFVEAPDTKKTKTWLDKLQIDDSMSKIIDNAVENGFIQTISKEIENQQDSKPLELDFNMNQKLVDFLKNNYQGRTVTGIKENQMKKLQLRQLIREEISKIIEAEVVSTPPKSAVKQTAASTAYQKTAQKATTVTSKANQIKNINDLPGAFQVWFDSLGLKGQAGVSQSAILSKIKETLTKMGIK
jgi:hypothetical protein